MRVVAAVVVVLVMVALGAWWSVQSRGPAGETPVSKPEATERREIPVRTMEDGARVQRDCMDLAHAVKAALSRLSAVPTSTRLRSLELTADGTCVIELSKEFAQVNSAGSTGESDVQNALRNALAAFGRVKKLTVVVDGSVFEGSHSGEWSDIPVAYTEPESTQ